ncbi:MAG: carbon-nitrogen family hydrolase [Synergistaceae bacterium]|nr:carbon-nitrogen family hydrolase [Synergistaceae bacterium]
MKIRAGVLQLDIALGDKKKNYENVERWMEMVSLPSDLPTVIVLPEIWDVGYALTSTEELADPEGRDAAAFLGGLARKYGVWFAGGSVLASTKGEYVNRAQVINPKGELVAFYDKVHLIRLMDEEKYLIGGRKECLFDLEGVHSGCVICYDIRFCEWLRTYALKGAELLFVSAEWPTVRADHWKTLLRARAIENQMFVVACNRCGTTEDTAFAGGSLILGPKGEILFEGGDGEEAGFVTLDLKEVSDIRSFLTVFNDRVPEIYGTHLK